MRKMKNEKNYNVTNDFGTKSKFAASKYNNRDN